MFRKMLSKYTIFSTVLSKIVGREWGGGGEGGDDQLKKNLQHRKWLKPQRRDRKKWFSNQILTLEVSVQGEEFFQKALLRRGHQQSQ